MSVNALQLIELVHQNDVLFDTRHPNFHDYQHKEAIWASIESHLQCPEGEGKRRWTMLRDAYRRNLKLLQRNPSRKAFKFSRQMSFLKPYFQKMKDDDNRGQGRESYSRYQYESRDGPEEVDIEGPMDAEAFAECLLGSELEEEDESRLAVDDVRSLRVEYKQAESYINDRIQNPGIRTYPGANKRMGQDHSDVIDAFVLSVGATLKTFSPYHISIAKQRIFTILSELEMDQIVTSASSSGMARVTSSASAEASSPTMAGKLASSGCSSSNQKDYSPESKETEIKIEPIDL